VSDALGFIRSWDLTTMSFDAAKNLTVHATEFEAYHLETLVDMTTAIRCAGNCRRKPERSLMLS
jgi:hypothetical protein